MRSAVAALAGVFVVAGATGDVHPDARKVLGETVKAYRSLKSVRMETTYTGNPGGFTKPLRSLLTMRRPNLLLYEIWQTVPGVMANSVMRYLCDGKHLFIYNQAERYYTREKAPRDLKSLRLSNAGIEYAAMTGADPFAGIERQARSVRLEGMAEVEGEPVDVVLIDTGTADRTAEARFFISRNDRLIRRFTFESIPIAKEPKAPPPPRERLNPDDPPEQELRQLPVRFGYDTKVTPNVKAPDSLFGWEAPADALLYEPLHQMLSPDREWRPGYVIVGKDGKRQKPLTFRDLVKMGKQQQRRRR